MAVKSTRQLILDHLRSKQVASAAELSRLLQVTPANVRHHLGILISEGVVSVIGERPATGRGRPALLYALSGQSSRHNLDRLCSALLNEIANPQKAASPTESLQRVAQELSGESQNPPGNLTRRLYQAIQRMNELNYQARWEARSDAPHVILGHCPYAAILSAHPELCRMDVLLLENLLQSRVEKVAHLARDDRGLTYCMFALKE
ncbi:MAG TPA: helix-turn-helix domain-containing protein [Anaerolineales bacterium]|nr:helix-turn-helix domain-containing protein [Anaerolineales bacterium]